MNHKLQEIAQATHSTYKVPTHSYAGLEHDHELKTITGQGKWNVVILLH